MSEHTDDSQDWPLRDFSARLRPPSRFEPLEDEEPPSPREAEGPVGPVEAAEAVDPIELDAPGEAEILFEDEPEASIVVDEPEAPAPEIEIEEELELEEPAPAAVEEHAEGDFRVPDGYSVLEGTPSGHRRAVAIVVSRFNGEVTNRLLESALAELEEAGVAPDAILVMPVPGAFELPIAAMALAKTRRYACVIALGCVIRGETPHFDFVAGEAASGLQLAGIETGVPVSFGVLTCDTAEQAEARVDRGAAAARSALEMADAFAQLRTTAARQ